MVEVVSWPQKVDVAFKAMLATFVIRQLPGHDAEAKGEFLLHAATQGIEELNETKTWGAGENNLNQNSFKRVLRHYFVIRHSLLAIRHSPPANGNAQVGDRHLGIHTCEERIANSESRK